MTPAARALGRRMRAGYAVVLLVLAAGLLSAGLQSGAQIAADARHSSMVNSAGRQRYLAGQLAQRATRALFAPQRGARASLDAALDEWSGQQAAVEAQLPLMCRSVDALCTEFAALRHQQRAIAALTADLPAVALGGAERLARADALDAALGAYLTAADRWVGEFARALARETLSYQRRVWQWSLLIFAATGVIVFFVLEPNIRRLQRERALFDEANSRLEIEKVRAQTALALLESHKQALDHHAIVSVTSPDGALKYVNERFCAISGYGRDELIGRHRSIVDSGVQSAEFHAAIIATRERGEVWHGELCHRAKNGRLYWVETTIVPVKDGGGRVVEVISIRTDITERKRAEERIALQITAVRDASEQLRVAKEAAEAASVAKGQFLANMSHEIRTPLNGVIGMTGLLLDSDLGSEQREYAEIARSSGEVLLALINNILDLSKIEAGQVELECIDFDLRSVVDETIDAVALKASEKRIELLVDIDATCPVSLRGDPTRLRQILLNLLSNAIKFTDSGDVTLSATRTPAPEGRLGLAFAIQDQGIGLSPEQIGKLFVPFTQADASTTRRHGGTGLGLSICRRLVEAMGGSIGIESGLGAGSTFRFHIEMAPSTQGAAAPPRRFTAPLRALIVDDHPVNLKILATQLGSWGMSVTTAGSAGEGLQRWNDLCASGDMPQVAILDQQLPDHDGCWLADNIRGLDAGGKCRLVLLSSLASHLQGVGTTHFDRAISKPVKSEALFRMLGEILGGPPQRTPDRPDDAGDLACLRVLLVDDNAVNQKLGLRLLTRLGLQVTQAWNGREALDTLRQLVFDVVLMDCQMPVMDGYEATRILRSTGSGVLDPQVPVIALTAHALSGDRDRCLAAGMNDHLAKPIDPKRLRAMLHSLVRRPEPHAAAAAADAPPADADAIDAARLRTVCGDDREFELDLLATFRVSATGLMALLDAAAARHAVADVKSLAHQLKGAASNICADGLAAAAAAVESAVPGELQSRIISLHQAWGLTARTLAGRLESPAGVALAS